MIAGKKRHCKNNYSCTVKFTSDAPIHANVRKDMSYYLSEKIKVPASIIAEFGSIESTKLIVEVIKRNRKDEIPPSKILNILKGEASRRKHIRGFW